MGKHMSTEPLITVLMPVYNAQRYLAQAIESILAQTYPDFEFLIIDDASTDASREIVLSYADPRIRLVQNAENLGQSATLNQGLGLAVGDYVAIMHADDVAVPERLAQQVQYLHQHPATAILGGHADYIDAEGNKVGRGIRAAIGYPRILWQFAFRNPMAHSSILLRRRDILQLGAYSTTYFGTQDYDLWCRAAREGLRIENVDRVLIQYRLHPTHP